MMVYKIEFYAYLPKIYICFHFFKLRSDPEMIRIRFFSSAEPDPDPNSRKNISDPNHLYVCLTVPDSGILNHVSGNRSGTLGLHLLIHISTKYPNANAAMLQG